jgi:transposase-like protein
MAQYSQERREAVLSKLLPPHNRPVTHVAREEGICTATLYNWLKSAKERGLAVPGSGKKTAEQWSGEAKLAVVLETASMNAEELSAYCRRKGLYPEQIERWKQACVDGAEDTSPVDAKAVQRENQTLRKAKRELEKQLRRKDKALAESAALLVLQKKYRALLEDEDE